jgi:hypothetical protein
MLLPVPIEMASTSLRSTDPQRTLTRPDRVTTPPSVAVAAIRP